MWVLHAIVLICTGVPKNLTWPDHPSLKDKQPCSSDQEPPASSKETVTQAHVRGAELWPEGEGPCFLPPLTVAAVNVRGEKPMSAASESCGRWNPSELNAKCNTQI